MIKRIVKAHIEQPIIFVAYLGIMVGITFIVTVIIEAVKAFA